MNSLQQTINKISLEWNEIFDKNFNSLDHAIALQPNNKFLQRNLQFFRECQAELAEGADFLVQNNHDTFHDGLDLFAKVVQQSNEALKNLSLSAELLEGTLAATEIDFPILKEQVKKLEALNESAEILSSMQSISLELAKAEKNIETLDVFCLFESISTISRHFLIVELKENFASLPHLMEMKLRFEKLQKLFYQSLQLRIEECIENPENTKVISRLFSILANLAEEQLKEIYSQTFDFLRESLPNVLSKKLRSLRKELFAKPALFDSFLQLDCILPTIQGMENRNLDRIFAEICLWLGGVLKFCNSLLRIGALPVGMQPFDLSDVAFLVIQLLKRISSNFIELPSPKNSSLYGFYLNDLDNTEHFCNEISNFQLPKELIIKNVEFSCTSPLYQRALLQQNQAKSDKKPLNSDSLESISASIASKNIFYLSIYENLARFSRLLLSESSAGKLPIGKEKLLELSEFIRSIWRNSFCSCFCSLVNDKLKSVFCHSSFFDGIILNDDGEEESERISNPLKFLSKSNSAKFTFKCIPIVEEIIKICSILIVSSQNEMQDDFLVPFTMEKIQFIVGKFESLYGYLFGEKFNSSSALASKTVTKAILDSCPFLLQLDLPLQDFSSNSLAQLAIQKEFLTIFQQKKDRAYRKEEILDLSSAKVDKVVLFFTSMMHLKGHFAFISHNLSKNDFEIPQFDKVLQQLHSLVFRAIYTLRIELRIQCVFYLELLCFDASPFESFMGQFLGQLAYLDAVIAKMAGITFSQMLFSGLPAFVNEVLGHCLNQLPSKRTEDEGLKVKIRNGIAMLQHGFINLCSSNEPLLIDLK